MSLDTNTPDSGTGSSIDALASSLLTLPPQDTGGDGEQQQAETQQVEETEPGEGQESAEEQEVQQQAQQPRKVTVKIGDKTEEVDEAELVKGYQRQADYTRKAQEIAEQRKATEAKLAEITAQRQAEVDQLTHILSWAEAKIPKPPVWDDADPIGSIKAKNEYDQEVVQFRSTIQAIEQRRAQLNQQQEQATAETLKTEHAKLLDAIPEWKDEDKAKTGRKEVGDYLLNAGYSADDLSGLSDHRAVVIARKAMMYDRLMANKADVTKKVQAAPTVLQPGGGNRAPVSDDTRALQRLAKTGRVEDLAAALIVRRK